VSVDAPFIFRFTRDLRLDDHAGLVAAASHGPILPVLVIDRALEASLSHSARRAAFYCAAVHALDASLRERGSRLIVRRGPLGASLRNVARASGAGGVAWGASYDGAGIQSDERLQSDLEEAGLRAAIVHDAPAIGPEDIVQARAAHEGAGYRAFAPYFELWRTIEVASYEVPLFVRFARSDLQSEPLPTPNEFGAADRAIEAGAGVARDALRSFLQDSVTQYALTMNVPSEDRTSHLSAHLSFGTVSARSVVRATNARAEDPFLLAEERASIKLFCGRSRNAIFSCSSRGFTRTRRTSRSRKKWRNSHSHVRTQAWTHGAGGARGFRSSTPGSGSCTKPGGCIRTSAPSPHRSAASIWAWIGAWDAMSGIAGPSRTTGRWRPVIGSGSPASGPTWRSIRASITPNVKGAGSIQPAPT